MAKGVKTPKININYLAQISQLKLNKSEIKSLQKALEDTISFINNLRKIDVSKNKPVYTTVPLKNVYFKDGEDNPLKLSQKEIFQNAKRKKNNFFVVDKIL